MSLLLTITAAPASISISESTKTFDVNGGTLGRGKSNTWILEDPERFLSSLHCQVSNENGQYYLTDLSTNGTFMNGAPDPMGKGCKLPLNDGDKFALGDYEFSVSLWNPAQFSTSPAVAEPVPDETGSGGGVDDFMAQDPFSSNDDFGRSLAPASDPFASGHISQSDSLFSTSPQETDPLLALDNAKGNQSLGSSDFSDPFTGSSYSDQADPMNQQISWPESTQDTGGGMIPDDWDDEMSPSQSQEPVPVPQPTQSVSVENTPQPIMPTPGQGKAAKLREHDDFQHEQEMPPEPQVSEHQIAAIKRAAMKKATAKVEAELKKLKKQVKSQQRNANAEMVVDTSLVDTLGFHGQSLTDEQIIQINAKAGEVIRESVKGLMQVLSSRSAIKNEFRMNVTTIQPVENNPLKFSANVDDALENMFIKQGNAYKKPIEAVQEGFDSIAEHQVAIIAGIRAAFKSVIERFDPVLLEERFSKGGKAGLIPGMQKAKNWDLYNEYYTDLVGDLDNSFQYLFGDDFVQAYEDQLRQLSMAKKAKAKDK